MLLPPRVWLLAALVCLIPAGCTSRPPLRKNPPTDPLLQSKTAVKARFGAADFSSRPEPSPPDMPSGAWAVAPISPSAARMGVTDPVPVRLHPSPFHWTSERAPVNEDATGKKEAFPWLQGTVEKTPREQFILHCEKGTPTPAGGRVLLRGHPRLDMFETGNVIRVEGRLIEQERPCSSGSWLPHPDYQVEKVHLLKRS